MHVLNYPKLFIGNLYVYFGVAKGIDMVLLASNIIV